MTFQYILSSIPLLANRQRDSIYKTTKKLGYLSLVTLITSNVSHIEAEYNCLVEPTKANCTRYINLAAALTQRAFDYDPGMLPEVAEVIFALRIKHANTGGPFIINLSGNYLLEFTKDRIHILDTYTKNGDVYEYQSTDPNITLGLSVSKGLSRNYKGIIIKEDAHGKLYDYAALLSDNISTDETMLRETLSHPFYEVAVQDGGEGQIIISKAMAFYHEASSHSRYTRCVKESMGILEQIQQILWPGSLVCEPEATSGIRSANHQSAAEMTLDQPLVEAPVKTSKYPERLGYRLEERVDLNGENPVAVLAAANFCQVSVKTILSGKHRQKRSPDSDDCLPWAYHMMQLYTFLDLNGSDIYQIVESIKQTNDIPASYFPGGQYPSGKEEYRATLVRIILDHLSQAPEVLQIAAAKLGEAAGASSFVDDCPAEPQACGESDASGRGIEIYTLNGQQFIPEPNVVKIVNRISSKRVRIVVRDSEQYTTNVIYLGDNKKRVHIDVYNAISLYIETMKKWVDIIKKKLRRCSGIRRKIFLESIEIAKVIHEVLLGWKIAQHLVISAVYHGDSLIGISIGRIEGRVYYPMHDIVSPESLFADDKSNRGQLTFLRSEVLKDLLSKGLIDKSELAIISKYSTGHDEL